MRYQELINLIRDDIIQHSTTFCVLQIVKKKTLPGRRAILGKFSVVCLWIISSLLKWIYFHRFDWCLRRAVELVYLYFLCFVFSQVVHGGGPPMAHW